MDTDNSNRCDWQEFQVACNKHILFTGDVPGAWRALDKDLVGFITLAQIDPMSAESLKNFKEWAAREFGSVRSAFNVFDANRNLCVSSMEFKKACRMYDYDGNAGTIFRALDVERNYALNIDDVVFLDDWELEPEAQHLEQDVAAVSAKDKSVKPGYLKEAPQLKGAACDPTSLNIEPPEKVSSARVKNVRRRAYTNMPTPDRVCWTDVPCRSISTPRKSRSSKGNSMWCSICKIRGFCSHVRAHAQRLVSQEPGSDIIERAVSATPALSEQRPHSSLARSPGLRASSSMSVHMPSWAWEAQCKLLPQISQDDAMHHHLSSMGCGSAEAEVQYMALCHFPMGTVTPVQATAALRTLAGNADTLAPLGCSP